ncbi:hypothetical protein J1N35_018903 [Gossypium stocksii]|uniref:Uncharacterized protein n=1 Tax=Gossypium stocksii TaxID=47602 RepID=A0A9D4A7M4_9ROSI|nr:hypothetical protein J1N35_018903 [Gossypium stocksii]
MHPEKGFTLKKSNYRDFMARIRQVVEALNWGLFCEKRPSVDEELVREFYANLTSSKLTEVLVHRIKEPITSNAINEFFELPDFENNEYSSSLSNIKPQRVEESEDPEEEEDDPTEIKLEQSVEVPDEAEPMELEAKPNIETSMFGAPPPSPDLRDELSKLMDIMQHMRCHQQAY